MKLILAATDFSARADRAIRRAGLLPFPSRDSMAVRSPCSVFGLPELAICHSVRAGDFRLWRA